MDIVLGVSMTPTTVRMVLVEGEKADGVTVDHDAFDIKPADGSATSSAADQVAAAVLGTQESAAASGHHLKSIGVTWTHHSDAAALRDTLAARGIEDVMLVSATHAAASLAQAVGRAIGYDTTALLFIEKDTATLSVVQTEDGSVVKVLSRDLHDSDAMAVFTEMATAVESAESPPQGLFIVGSGVDAAAVKAHLENLVALPVSAPEEPELALARGAALASAHAPEMEASTAGLAYSQDPDGTTAGSAYPELAGAATQMAGVATQMAPVDAPPRRTRTRWRIPTRSRYAEPEPESFYEDESRKPFLLVGSALDVDLRCRRCRPGDFAGGQHPPDGRPAAQPRRDAGDPEPGRACPRASSWPRRSAACAGPRRPAAGDHQGARARRAAGPGASATDGLRREARTRCRAPRPRLPPRRLHPCPPHRAGAHPGSGGGAADLQPAGVQPAAAGLLSRSGPRCGFRRGRPRTAAWQPPWNPPQQIPDPPQQSPQYPGSGGYPGSGRRLRARVGTRARAAIPVRARAPATTETAVPARAEDRAVARHLCAGHLHRRPLAGHLPLASR